MLLQEIFAGVQLAQCLGKELITISRKKPLTAAKAFAISQLKDLKSVCGMSLAVIDMDLGFDNTNLQHYLFGFDSDRNYLLRLFLLFIHYNPMSCDDIYKEVQDLVNSNTNNCILPSTVSIFQIQRDIRSSSPQSSQNEQFLNNRALVISALYYICKRFQLPVPILKEVLSFAFQPEGTVLSFDSAHDDDPTDQKQKQTSNNAMNEVKENDVGEEILPRGELIFGKYCLIIQYFVDQVSSTANVETRVINSTLDILLATQPFNGAHELRWLRRSRRTPFNRRRLDLIDAEIMFNPVQDTMLIIVKDCGLKLRGPDIQGRMASLAASDIRCAIVRRVIELSRRKSVKDAVNINNTWHNNGTEENMLNELDEQIAKSKVSLFNEEIANLYDFVAISGVLSDCRRIWGGSAFSSVSALSSYGSTIERRASYEVKRPLWLQLELCEVRKLQLYWIMYVAFSIFRLFGMFEFPRELSYWINVDFPFSKRCENEYIVRLCGHVLRSENGEYVFLRKFDSCPSLFHCDAELDWFVKCNNNEIGLTDDLRQRSQNSDFPNFEAVEFETMHVQCG